MTSRAGRETLVTGIEYLPFGSLTAPGGRVGPLEAIWAVGLEATMTLPLAFRAVTRTRSRWPTSAEDSAYLVVVAPEIAGQFEPSGRPPSADRRLAGVAGRSGRR